MNKRIKKKKEKYPIIQEKDFDINNKYLQYLLTLPLEEVERISEEKLKKNKIKLGMI